MVALVCSHCGAVAQPGVEYCPKCLGSLGPALGPEAGSPAASPSAPVEAAPQPPAVPCPRHPERAVLGTCVRCGTFVCVACLPADTLELERALCLDCETSRGVRERPETVRGLFRQAGIALLLFAVVSIGFWLVGIGAEVVDPKYTSVHAVVGVGVTLAAHLPLVACGVLTWAARLRVAGWVGVAVACVMFLPLGGFSLFWLFLGGANFVAALSLWRIGSLRQEAHRPDAPPT